MTSIKKSGLSIETFSDHKSLKKELEKTELSWEIQDDDDDPSYSKDAGPALTIFIDGKDIPDEIYDLEDEERDEATCDHFGITYDDCMFFTWLNS